MNKKPTLILLYRDSICLFICFLWMQLGAAQIGIHGDVQLASNFTVGFLSPSLHFENGIVQGQEEAEATVYFSPDLSWTNASHKSHIASVIEVDDHEGLVLPLGDGQTLHPLVIHNADNTNLRVAYKNQAVFSGQLDNQLEHIAPFHWRIESSLPVQVSLTWNVLSDISQLTPALEGLVFVGYDGLQWKEIPAKVAALDLVNQEPSSLTVGSITSENVIDFSTYTHLTIASKAIVTDLFVSEVFTPNGDGTNDVWYIRNAERYPKMEIRVYNRWGTEVFSTSNGYNNRWNGSHKNNAQPLPSSSYYYQIDLEADGALDFQGWVFINY